MHFISILSNNVKFADSRYNCQHFIVNIRKKTDALWRSHTECFGGNLL